MQIMEINYENLNKSHHPRMGGKMIIAASFLLIVCLNLLQMV